MGGGQASTCAGAHSNAVVTICVHPYLGHAAGLIGGLLDVGSVNAFALPQRQAHGTKGILPDTRQQADTCTLAGGSYRSIAALAAGADAEVLGQQGFAAYGGALQLGHQVGVPTGHTYNINGSQHLRHLTP